LAAARIALELDPRLVLSGPPSLHRHVLERTLALELDRAEDRAALAIRAELLLSLGRADVMRGLYRTARAPFEEALRIARELGDRRKEGWAACLLAHALAHLGRGDEAGPLAERAIAVAIESRDMRLRSMAEYALGSLALLDGRHDEAVAELQRALASAREEGSPRLLGIALGNLSVAHRRRGEPVEARAFLAEARRMFESAADDFHLGKVAVDEAILEATFGPADRGATAAGTTDALDAALTAVIERGDIEAEIEAREALLGQAVARGETTVASRRWDDLAILVRSTESAVWRERVQALRPIHRGPAVGLLRVTRDGRRVVLDGRELDFGRRGPLRRILVELVRRRLGPPENRRLALPELLAAGWPHEKMRATSGAARVYMAVRRLRSLGLERIVCTSDEGYFLEPRADVAWLEDDVR